MKFDLNRAEWIFEPDKYIINGGELEITTDPNTDFWQRTYYGFRNDNAPGLLYDIDENFTFGIKASFEYKTMFDQCGLLIYLDSDNWMKAGLEYENEQYSRLGSVVTNNGYSDWATTDVDNCTNMYFKLHRRGSDFLIESSADGLDFRQMRIFHMHALGETTAEMGKQMLPSGPAAGIRFGLFACSPGDSSFTVRFTEIELTDCRWKSH